MSNKYTEFQFINMDFNINLKYTSGSHLETKKWMTLENKLIQNICRINSVLKFGLAFCKFS